MNEQEIERRLTRLEQALTNPGYAGIKQEHNLVRIWHPTTVEGNLTVTGLLNATITGYATASHRHDGLIGQSPNTAIPSLPDSSTPEIRGTGGAAAMSFHRPGLFALHFGVDTDNKLKVGGWSLGANAYEILNTANLPTLLPAALPVSAKDYYMEVKQANNHTVTSGAWNVMAFTDWVANTGNFTPLGNGYAVPAAGMYIAQMAVAPSWSGAFSIGFQALNPDGSVQNFRAVEGFYGQPSNIWETAECLTYLPAGWGLRPVLYQASGVSRAFNYVIDYGNYFRMARV